jgi:hypothetical protein
VPATNFTVPSGLIHRVSFFLRLPSGHHPQKNPATRNTNCTQSGSKYRDHSLHGPCHCRVFFRGHALYALTNPAGKPRRTRYSLHQPLSHGLSSLSSLNSHISAKTLPRRPRPHLSTTTILSDRASTRRRIFRPSSRRLWAHFPQTCRWGASGCPSLGGLWRIGRLWRTLFFSSSARVHLDTQRAGGLSLFSLTLCYFFRGRQAHLLGGGGWLSFSVPLGANLGHPSRTQWSVAGHRQWSRTKSFGRVLVCLISMRGRPPVVL